MLAEVAFLTQFLGLVAGRQVVALQAGPEVAAIEIRLDGRALGAIRKAPWSAEIDLGPALRPHELEAVAFDAEGREVATAAQILNLARPAAELEIFLEPDAEGHVAWARMDWTAIYGVEPARATLRLNGKIISRGVSRRRVAVGRLDPQAMHFLSAEVEFPNGARASKEISFGGIYSEQMPAELTAVAVRRLEGEPNGGCAFRVGDQSVTPAAVERGTATVSFVVNGTPGLGVRRMTWNRQDALFAIREVQFRVVSPVAQSVSGRSGESSLFDAELMSGSRGTRLALMTKRPKGIPRFADALAVAAVRALPAGRRVVVMAIGSDAEDDHSLHTPETVRGYLRSIGVPLHVWSLSGPRPDLEAVWGEVRDVSTPARLIEATQKVAEELDAQRIAWLPVPPLDAFRAVAGEGCGFRTIALAP